MSAAKAYDQVLQEPGGPLGSCSQSNEPRNIKQVYNSVSKNKARSSESADSEDELCKVIRKMEDLEVVKSIIVEKGRYYFFVATEKQVKDIVKFCCEGQGLSSVLGIDTTFNLFKLWVTDSCYENYHLVNPRTREHPTFLGPSLFHFTKDE